MQRLWRKKVKLQTIILDLEYKNDDIPIKEQYKIQYNGMDLPEEEYDQALLISSDEQKIRWAINHEIAVLGVEVPDRNVFLPCSYVIENILSLSKVEVEKIFAREKNMPCRILETNRLLIREMSGDDMEALYDLYSDETITPYVEPLFKNREEEYTYIQDYANLIYKFYDLGMWLIIEKETGTLIGRAGVEPMDYNGETVLELGYLIGKKWQRMGYAKEACTGILNYVRELEIYPYVDALIEVKNVNSKAFIQSLGFQKAKEEFIGKKPMERWRKILHF